MAERLETFVRRRIAREPLAYILGRKEFWSLSFEVGPGVLVPRPETEILLAALQREFPDSSAPLDILDLGTGSANLLVGALVLFPRALGTGIDNSVAAMNWARRNVFRHGISSRCELITRDWNERIDRRADAILVNPPYIAKAEFSKLAPEVAKFEPVAALSGGPDGLDAFRTLAPQIVHTLKSTGAAFLEIGEGQADAVVAILAASGLRVLRIEPDLAGIPRCVVCRLSNDSVN